MQRQSDANKDGNINKAVGNLNSEANKVRPRSNYGSAAQKIAGDRLAELKPKSKLEEAQKEKYKDIVKRNEAQKAEGMIKKPNG